MTPKHIPLFSSPPSVYEACLAITNIIFAYAGHVAFFTLFSELRSLKDYPKSLALLQVSEMLLYTITAVVMYSFVGPGIASPALNSAGEIYRKISYGIAIPTVCGLPILSPLTNRAAKIVIAGVVNAHVAVLYGPITMGLYMRCPLDFLMDNSGEYTGV
ncbi:hypothetical protein PHISCL_02019 [Aspergillus sclerotialis]|uniref:Amino acid transporter transmembrane domain-containing protein n=1 Tax=Aspergillus sclerotialis TaxID=2070753 RepID=A0A3A2ZRH7_9EURO|nr:hypothetical protein PHISCL_02019 [Aspergillus sclerotialis]